MGRTDQELVNRVLQRDQDAFDELFARHGPSVRRQLVRMLRDPGVTEDLTQEVFLRLWTRANQWEGRGSLEGWLHRVATNLTLNHLRSVQRRRERPLPAPRPQYAHDEEDASSIADWLIDVSAGAVEAPLALDERHERLHRLVAELPEDYRDVIRLVFDEEMDLRSAADALGIPKGTVKSRLHYAKRRLAEKWEHDD